MKEAAGEANMTVITIVLIGIIAAIAIPLVSNLMSNSAKQACCQNKGYVWKDGSCQSYKNGTYTKVADTKYWDTTNNACK